MKKIFLTGVVLGSLIVSVYAQEKSSGKEELLKQKHLKEQMQREKKYAHEQKFYQGKEYDLSEQKVDPKDLDSIPVIEPENDFDMTDVYRDDI